MMEKIKRIFSLWKLKRCLNKAYILGGLILVASFGLLSSQVYAEDTLTLPSSREAGSIVLSLEGAPAIQSTFPAANDIAVKTSVQIIVNFEEEMDPESFNNESFLVERAGKDKVTPKSIYYDEVSHSVTFIPYTQLETSSLYKVTLTQAVKSESGVPLSEPLEWSFTTDREADPFVVSEGPKVSYTEPLTAAIDVGVEQAIVVHFQGMMDTGTITEETYFITPSDNPSAKIVGQITPSQDKRSFTFVPASELENDQEYTATILKQVEDLDGISMISDYSWKFKTGEDDHYSPHGYYTDNPNACYSCHQTHTAAGESLLKQNAQTNVCYTCHDGSGSKFDIRGSMMVSGDQPSFHPIKDTQNPTIQGELECTTCHNPHGDKDPAGEYYPSLLRVTDGDDTVYSGIEYCLACHKPGGLAQNRDMSTYMSSYHNIPGGVSCTECHAPHSSANPSLQKRAPDRVEQSESGGKVLIQGECLECHAQSEAQGGATNVGNDFLKTSGHLNLESESPLRCTDCHDPHSSSTEPNCLECHGETLSAEENSGFSIQGVQQNLHSNNNHATESCLSCHQPHGSDYRNSVIDFYEGAIPSEGSWSKETCNTLCHTPPQQAQVPAALELPLPPTGDVVPDQPPTQDSKQNKEPPVSEGSKGTDSSDSVDLTETSGQLDSSDPTDLGPSESGQSAPSDPSGSTVSSGALKPVESYGLGPPNQAFPSFWRTVLQVSILSRETPKPIEALVVLK